MVPHCTREFKRTFGFLDMKPPPIRSHVMAPQAFIWHNPFDQQRTHNAGRASCGRLSGRRPGVPAYRLPRRNSGFPALGKQATIHKSILEN
jgi:hypothetical protein